MSVINQMLSDLQQRQESVKQLPLQPINYKKSSIFLYILIFSSVLVLVPILWFNKSSSVSELKTKLALHSEKVIALKTEEDSIQSLSIQDKESLILETKNNPLNPVIVPQVIQRVEPEFTSDNMKEQSPLLIEKAPVLVSKPKVNFPVNKHLDDNLIKDKPDINYSADINETVIKKPSNETIRINELEEIKQNFPIQGYQITKTSLNNLLLNNPDFHAARLYLILLSWQNNAIETPQIINSSISLYPNQSAFRLAAARFYLEKIDYQQAENSLLNIQPTTDNLPELLQMRAVIRQKNNKHQLAVEDYTSILRLSPDRGEIYIALGISLEALNENNQALQSYKKAELDQRLSTRQLQFVKNKIQLYSQQSQG